MSELSLSPRANLIRRASAKLPFTAEGLPVGIYRADMLPSTSALGDQFTETSQSLPVEMCPSGEAQDFARIPTAPSQTNNQLVPAVYEVDEALSLEAAYMELSFEHGYPTLPDGRTFWSKLDYEPSDAHVAFSIYLESSQYGPRELQQVANNRELRTLLSGDPAHLPPTDVTLQLVNEWYHLYYWRHRCKAHDLFQEAAYRHIRMRRAMSCEDFHYVTAEKLLTKILTYIEKDSFMEEMTPKVAIDALKSLIAIQRVSAGLPAAAPLSNKDDEGHSSFEMIMRKLVSSNQGNLIDETGRLIPQDDNILSSVLQDPNSANMLQEVIIKVTERRNGTPTPQRFGALRSGDDNNSGETDTPYTPGEFEDF